MAPVPMALVEDFAARIAAFVGSGYHLLSCSVTPLGVHAVLRAEHEDVDGVPSTALITSAKLQLGDPFDRPAYILAVQNRAADGRADHDVVWLALMPWRPQTNAMEKVPLLSSWDSGTFLFIRFL
jgi:hypothetical protein